MVGLRTWRAQRVGEAAKLQSTRLLLVPSEIGAVGWVQTDERSWRTGVLTHSSDEAVRAQHEGSVSSLRMFLEPTSKKVLMLQVVPMASNADASTAVPHILEHVILNPQLEAQSIGEELVEKTEVPWLTNGIAREITARAPHGIAGNKLAVSSTKSVVVAVVCAPSVAWTWDEIAAVWSSQSQKIERLVRAAPPAA